MVFNTLRIILLLCWLDNFVESASVFGTMAVMVDAQLGTNATKCPAAQGWVTAPTNPCTCLYIDNNAVPVGTTYMSANEFCINSVDSRSVMVEFNTQTEMLSFQSTIATYQSMVGSDIPVGFYKSTGTDVRSLSRETVLPPFSPPISGNCQYFLATATNTFSCMQKVSAVACIMPCDNPPAPPPPTETTGVPRCGDPTYNSTCPSGWINLGGVCYKNPANTLTTYSDAVTACQTAGGWLPSFSNVEEWTAVKNYVYTTGIAGVDSYAAPMWLGGTLSGTTATWTDGTPWQFSYWAPYQPLSGSTCMRWSVTNGGYWSAGDCDIPGAVFCQYYDQCPTTSTTSTSSTTTTIAATSSSSKTSSSTSASTSTTKTTTSIPTTTSTMTTSTTTPQTSRLTSTSPLTPKPQTASSTSSITSSTSTTLTVPSMSTGSTTMPMTSTSPKSLILTSTSSATPMLQAASSISTISTSKPTSLTSAPSLPTGSTMMPMTSSSPIITIAASRSTTDGICVNQIDFSTKCLQNPAASYWKGICYEIASNCSSPSRLGVIREIDIIENFLQRAQQGSTPLVYPISLYIGSYNNDPNAYVQLNGMVSSTGQHRLAVSLGAGQCLGIISTSNMTNVYNITDSMPCTGSLSFCEILPTFEQKGCEQSLSTGSCTVVSTVIAANVTDCAKQCSVNDWCAGVNYNQQSQTCNFLSENSSMKTVTCDPGWFYYERV